MPTYVEERKGIGIKRDFAKEVWKLFKTKAVNLRVILSTDDPCAFVRDVAAQRKKVKLEAEDTDECGDFERMVHVDEVASPGVQNKVSENQQLCEGKRETVLTSVVERIELSVEVV